MVEPQAPSGAEMREISHELTTFRSSAMLLSQTSPRLIDDYNGRWVAVLDGRVLLEAADPDDLFARMAEANIDSRYALVRHIQSNQRSLIL